MILLGDLYIVVMDRGGIFGTYYGADLAEIMAKSINGVVAKVPIVADYRVDEIESTKEAR